MIDSHNGLELDTLGNDVQLNIGREGYTEEYLQICVYTEVHTHISLLCQVTGIRSVGSPV
jgi:hypothetical protein